jgi:hypothetical protein
MTRLTRRRAIETMGAAAVFAAGLKRPAFADAAAGAVGIDKALTEAVNSGRVPGLWRWRPTTKARSFRAGARKTPTAIVVR